MATIKYYEILANLLIVLLVALSIIRVWEWLARTTEDLRSTSEIFIALENVIDIKTTAFILLVGSIILLASVFSQGTMAYTLLIIGSLVVGTIHMLYGAAIMEQAQLMESYYRALTLGITCYAMAAVGGIALWQTMRGKKKK